MSFPRLCSLAKVGDWAERAMVGMMPSSIVIKNLLQSGQHGDRSDVTGVVEVTHRSDWGQHVIHALLARVNGLQGARTRDEG